MKLLSYTYLDQVGDLKGREAAYSLYLQTEYYQTKFREVLEGSNQNILTAIDTTGKDNLAALGRIDNKLLGLDKTFEEGFEMLGDGIADINFNLSEVYSEINKVSGLLDWGFNALIENQRVSHILMMNIAELLKIPDFEKERLHFIGEGLKHLRNAIFDADMYAHAEQNFKKALERNSTDYFTLFRMGLIHLFSPRTISFIESIDYLQSALKFLRPEIIHNKGLQKNVLRGKGVDLYTGAMFSPEDLKSQAAIISYYLGTAFMLSGQYEEGRHKFTQALDYNPDFPDAKYQLAKACFLLSTPSYATLLRELIQETPLYFLKASNDKDFCSNDGARGVIKQIYTDRQTALLDRVRKLQEIADGETEFGAEVRSVEVLLSGTYFDLLRAERMLARSRKVTLHKVIKDGKYDLESGRLNVGNIEVEGDLLRIVGSEQQFRKEIREREAFFFQKYPEYKKKIEARKLAEIEAKQRNALVGLIFQIIVFVATVTAFLHLGKLMKSRGFVYRPNVVVEMGIVDFIQAYPLNALLFGGFGIYVAVLIIKQIWRGAFAAIDKSTTQLACMIFFNGAGLIVAYENWQERVYQYGSGFWEGVSALFSTVIIVIISSILAKLVGYVFKKVFFR